MASILLTIVVSVALAAVAAPISSSALPFILLHGIDDECKSDKVSSFTQNLTEFSGVQGYCVEIGNGKLDSWFMPLLNQTDEACEKVKGMKELSGGFNIVGISQGNIIARGLIEFCDGRPPVKNYVSVGGPHAGVAYINCTADINICIVVEALTKPEIIYSDFVQENLAPSGFYKIPTEIDAYLKGSRFLPKLNNELPDKKNSTYKERLTSLQNLVLIMFENDTVVVPHESSWFGYYPDGANDLVLPPQQTTLYKEDWIGLKALDDAGRVKYVSLPGEHLEISQSEIKKYVVPYLADGSQIHTFDESSSILELFSSSRDRVGDVNVEEEEPAVHGMEYGFGAHEYSSSGVFEVEPKSCPGFVYRRSIWLGSTDMSPSEFCLFLEQLSGKYHGCYYFAEDRFTSKIMLARLVSSSFCNCLLPQRIQATTARHLPDLNFQMGSSRRE